ncbi:MAG: hypothetical protein JWO11_4432 [Nocardioides sp.]|nr:hypothetical protein [Nocardioides sp.]
MLDVQIGGAAQLRKVAAGIRATGDKGLGRQMSRALAASTKPIQRSIDAESEKVMPKRGGYRAVFAKSLRHKTSQRTSARNSSLTLITYADGTGERRDVQSLEGGALRHPVFGRSRTVRGRGRVPNPWTVTRIRSGFHKRGTDGAADEAERQLSTVLGDFASRLAKG